MSSFAALVGAAEDPLQILLAEAPFAVAIIEGLAHTHTFANPAYLELAGGRDIVGKPLLEAQPHLRGQGFEALLDAVVSSGAPHRGTEVAVLIDVEGELVTRYYNFVYQPRRGAAGDVTGVIVCAADVSAQVEARLRAEAALEAQRQSEVRLRLLIDATGAGTWEIDLVTRQVTVNARMRAMHSLPEDGPVALEEAFSRVHPDDEARVRASVASALAPTGNGRFHEEYRVRGAAGAHCWVEARGAACSGATGERTGLAGTVIDITARKELEFGRQGLLEALAAQPFMQVCVLDGPRHVVTLVNAAYRERVAGGRDIVGMPVLDAFPTVEGAGFDGIMHRVLETGVPFVGREVPTRLELAGGRVEERFFDFVVQPVRGAGGAFDTLLNLSQDVTEVVAVRSRLEALAAQEKAVAAFERQLIGIVSHDLRNPLSVLRMGVSLLLQNEDVDPASMKVLLRLHATTERMVRLVSDLLDFTQARIGNGLPVVRARMNLHDVVRQVAEEVQMVQMGSPSRRIELDARGDGDGAWDHDRLAQVTLNLLSNALKYSPADAAVRVTTRGLDEHVELQIRNEGRAIEADLLPNVFEPMQRGRGDADPTGRSVGLGLYIVKNIVEAHGGSVRVTSAEGDGTTFTVVLPRHVSG